MKKISILVSVLFLTILTSSNINNYKIYIYQMKKTTTTNIELEGFPKDSIYTLQNPSPEPKMEYREYSKIINNKVVEFKEITTILKKNQTSL